MGRLKDFMEYLGDRRDVLDGVERRLCDLQAKYETYFAEVAAVRERELGQLIRHTVASREQLPDWYLAAVETARVAAEAELDRRLADLHEKLDHFQDWAESLRRKSREDEVRLRQQNVELDTEEEELKARNQQLLAQIADYNGRIRALGRGFGFFANFFSMRALARTRRELDREQADVAARIHTLRACWEKADREHAEREAERREEWLEVERKAASVAATLETLEARRPELVVRDAVERVLAERVPEPAGGAEAPCPRCGTPNPEGSHFCSICAATLAEDRPDFAGSVEEMAELNRHFERFSTGMQAGQELIGLVRGLASGVEAFTTSVKDVLDSEKKYPLPKLEIDVPASSVEFGRRFDQLAEAIGGDLSVHPMEFAERVRGLVDGVFTEDAIKTYFETMGEELSRQAEAQW